MPNNEVVRQGLTIVRAGIDAVQADRLMDVSGTLDAIRHDVEAARRLFVVGAGKAALAMASVAEAEFGDKIDRGVVAVPNGYPDSLPRRYTPPTRIVTIAGGLVRADERRSVPAATGGPRSVVAPGEVADAR